MSRGFDEQLADAVRAVEILSPTRHVWLGERDEPLPPSVERQMDAATARGYLAYNVTNALYANFYCQGMAAPPPRPKRHDPMGDGPFVQSLSAANSGRGCWEPGWSVARVENGSVEVERGGLTMVARRDGCRPEDGAALEPPARVSVRYPKELLRLSPGFYMALADEALPLSADVVRLYWNITPEQAVGFVGTATRALNEHGVSARLKVVNDPGRYDRCDAAVVYLHKEHYARAAPAVAELLDALGGSLGQRTPALTKPLAPGLGVAEDPGGGESFGMSRCQLIAEGLIRAHERGERDLDGRVAVVRETLTEGGVDVEAPFLGAGSEDAYELL